MINQESLTDELHMPVIWELDFYSRPVVDENQKKLWEVLICESPLSIESKPESLFRYSQFYANTEVNSGNLRQAIEAAIAQAPKPPDRIRFFRRQMANMISKACDELGIPGYASRRTIALNQWINQRMAEEYPTYPNYQPGSNPSVMMPSSDPQPLPDALIGQRWAFVSLEASAFADMSEWEMDFSEAFPLDLLNLAPNMTIPGLLVFSQRSLPLAAWMSGLEMAFVKLAPGDRPQLLLETGSNDAWILANLSSPALQKEAKDFEAAKEKANGVHFLAVQSGPEAETFAGFWLMQELNLA
ncbi:Tab2/Atab2 family RNA-binding protein [Leptolyngbya sp. AN02str]|uniref:Tab2/Atab2 family RNA-binding protein n=1 Tax=Leptolyngbya sp. AN02str TaxID=3423363 RepID=UPI003D310332